MGKNAVVQAVVATLLTVVQGQVPVWSQCGGIYYTSSTVCAAGSVCSKINDWYSQCLPAASVSPTPTTASPSSSSQPLTVTPSSIPTVNPTTSSPPATSTPSTGGEPPITNNGVSSYNWCGKRKWIALTFDDWWPSPAIDDILADLKANNLKASFFLSPGLSSPDPDICTKLKNVLAAGHSINSHSYSHPHFPQLTAEQRATELKQAEDVVYNQCGLPAGTMKQFRPPYVDLNREIALEVNKAGYTVVSCTYDPVDWDSSTNQLSTVWANSLQRFSELPAGSSAVVLHHTWAYVETGTKGIIAKYKNYFAPLGYEFVTVNQCFEACLADGDCKLVSPNTPGVFDF
ncbi:unnamed protein product [Aphanomyces euteiches]|uniref:NodB homology domain-containing protein n=1 Tax=Aphanomyces euteiches TaxID=100861 RepID=A0A6G0WCX8_9STRA|nr:hypothetical protein Ae201684_016307 [Aphanomyces euteiches]KAH9079869.1 hypothetical protein Ae201684P_007578 [Aphanomyces euteiches]